MRHNADYMLVSYGGDKHYAMLREYATPLTGRQRKALKEALPRSREVILVGIGGPSGGGKTALGNMLCKAYGSPCTTIELSQFIHQGVQFDAMPFLHENEEVQREFGRSGSWLYGCGRHYECFEDPSSLDVPLFVEAMTDLMNNFKYCKTCPSSIVFQYDIIRPTFREAE